MPEFSDTELLDMFEGMYDGNGKGDYDLRCYTTRVVRTRTEHECPGNFAGALHTVPAGCRMLKEHAIVEDQWRTCYTCEDCVIKYAKEFGSLRYA